MDIARRVERALGEHGAVRRVRLIGSRARSDPTPFSDWDFEIVTDDFPSVSIAIPSLVASLRPIAQQWDRLSTKECYMLVLNGPEKVDLLFDVPHKEERRWTASASTLQAIDDHFWDWLLWLLSKEAAGREEVVFGELG
jgi:nucleotidyltransferase-like protein